MSKEADRVLNAPDRPVSSSKPYIYPIPIRDWREQLNHTPVERRKKSSLYMFYRVGIIFLLQGNGMMMSNGSVKDSSMTPLWNGHHGNMTTSSSTSPVLLMNNHQQPRDEENQSLRSDHSTVTQQLRSSRPPNGNHQITNKHRAGSHRSNNQQQQHRLASRKFKQKHIFMT